MIKNKIAEYRTLPTNEKALEEQRADLLLEMNKLLEGAKAETRILTDDEEKRFEEIKKEIKKIDTTLTAIEEERTLQGVKPTVTQKEKKEEIEERAFANYIKGVVETRADVNLTPGNNGAIIPSTIAKKIIKKVHDISPIYQLATKYNVGGTLSIPYYDETSGNIQMAYASEFVDLESTNGRFQNIQLTGFLAGALSKISKSLINNSQFDLVSFVIDEMAQSIARWIEKELLNGTDAKIQGLRGVTQAVTAASATAVVADELIDVQEAIPDMFQNGAIWIMNKATRSAIRKLKDNDGNYLLNKDVSAKWGYTLLGKDVYTSENMPTMATGKTAIYYGDMSGLAVKITEDMNIEVLREKYATQHAIGIVSWLEMDSKVENAQKISKLVMKTV
ncbi:phage major capsid protein [Clostridium tertium]|uniref:phage major capsid protein n=1 Tax=Clostridium tertium TaxID=1559 RepID=UPI00232C6B9D|nr:phage major capsid protein [Clostridium tertium]MDB1924066.1 phage major capsid protein [Clostridium tertium]MDB1927173.1 phage major capsid protein [Clostridium tertium]MDB1930950.1 phage major capsid protein [Clostridium tertium]